ncbi:unnamed protein product, partial [Prorocentrum cordatum]
MAGPGPAAETSRWHRHDWDAVLSGGATADRYFARPGLIRKDRLAGFAPPDRHPATAAASSFAELRAALFRLGVRSSEAAGRGEAAPDPACVQFVLKKAHSSNASGIRFLTGADAQAAAPADARRAAKKRAAPGELGARRAAALAVAGAAGVLAAAALGAREPRRAEPRGAAAGELRRLLGPAAGEEERDGGGKPEVWVVQRYVAPALHQGRKFHLRALLLCVGDLSAYLHEGARVLLASEPFELGRRDAGRFYAHVTNMGASSGHDGFAEGAQNLPLSALGAEEEAERILREAAQAVGGTLARLRAAGRRQFFTLPNCWELFGVDLLLDESRSRRVLLLEVNPSPSLAMFGDPDTVRQRLLGGDPLQDAPG